MNSDTVISKNLQIVRENIEDSAALSGRSGREIKLIGVTKFQPIEKVSAAIEAGLTEFGENYADQAVDKITHFKDARIRWHMIGHVQSRKANLIAEHFNLVHTLDSLKLAKKLSERMILSNTRMDCLIEVNIAGEESKSGYSINSNEAYKSLLNDLMEIITLPGIRLLGLMCMPPLSAGEKISRSYFVQTRDLLLRLGDQIRSEEWKELSMGTSSDYQMAIENGSTMVRIGTSIFGERIQRN